VSKISSVIDKEQC